MADPEDLKIYESGEKDLQRCDLSDLKATGKTFEKVDFRGCNLKGADFSGSIFTECDFRDAELTRINFHQVLLVRCLFNKVIFRANFDEAKFEGGRISSLLTRSSFRGTKFYNVDVSGLRFGDENIFDESALALGTDFDGVSMPRSLARAKIFSNYAFERGKLTQLHADNNQESTSQTMGEEDVPESHGASFIATVLRSNQGGAQLMCLSLSRAIDDFIASTPTPNDPDKLNYHQDYISVLEAIKEHINKIADDLSNIGALDVDGKIKDAKDSVISLRAVIQGWWDRNSEKAVQYGANVGLLGAGTAFLTFCGAPPPMATGICAVLSGSKPVIDYLREVKEAK